MNVLVLGSGGREHAIAWKLSREESTTRVYVFPGNDGIFNDPQILRPEGSYQNNFQDIERMISNFEIELVVPGPEKLMADGLVDQLSHLNISIWGPTQSGAKLETSKIFSKKFAKENNIPTASFLIAKSSREAYKILEKSFPKESVIKVDGLAGGKGVVVANQLEEAKSAVTNFLDNPEYPVKDQSLLIEERLYGREVSIFYMCDQEDFLYIGHAHDYKRLQTGNLGPNTGGMGCYFDERSLEEGFLEEVEEKILKPTLKGMLSRGTPYKGFLFLGLMITESGPQLIEYNVRMGDPETQTIFPNLNLELAPLMKNFKEEREANSRMSLFKYPSCLHVVLTSKGYPGLDKPMLLDQPISINLESDEERWLFYAGVKRKEDFLVNCGGRVLGVTSTGDNLKSCREKTYQEVEGISFKGCYYREDIGNV